jgi:hypothetical protein
MRRALVFVAAAACVLATGLPTVGAAPSPDEQVIVVSGLLRRADFPAGWQVTKGSSSPNFAKLGVPCRPLVRALNRRVDKASSPGFLQGNTERASNTAVLYEQAAGAVALVAALQNPVTTACYRRSAAVSVAQTAARSKVKLQVVSVAPVSVAAAGDQSLGYEAVVRASSGGQTEMIYEDAVFVRVGRAVLSFDFVNTGSSPSAAFGPQIQAVIGRVEAAE